MRLLTAVKSPWWIAGGWALDLFVGRQTRPHEDLDIGILRRDAPQVVASMAGWEFFAAKDRCLQRLEHDAPGLEVNSLWGRPRGERVWGLELMLDEAEGDTWVFRRERSIRRPLDAATARTTDGLRHLAPEIQLLYKAKHARPKDDADFRCVAPRLDSSARTWLRDALARVDERHEWITALETQLLP
jgi:hypothetical protein